MPLEDCSKQKLLEDFCIFYEIKDHPKKINEFLKKKEDYITIYTDGACLSNGKMYAKAGVGIFIQNTKQEFSYVCKDVIEKHFPDLEIIKYTNQKAELLAIFKALVLLDSLKFSKNQQIRIKTDSMYSINIFTKWYKSWIKNDWKTATGKQVENKEIIMRVISLLKSRKVQFFHVEAHKPRPDSSKTCYVDWYGNDMADKLASKAARM